MPGRLTFVTMLPLVVVIAAVGFWFNDVQDHGPYVLRNLIPPLVVLVLVAVSLLRGEWRWRLGTAGFAIPALGLAIYLHYAYSVNLNGMFDDAEQPAQLFRFLPVYTLVAGGIGFIIGWIVGRNV